MSCAGSIESIAAPSLWINASHQMWCRPEWHVWQRIGGRACVAQNLIRATDRRTDGRGTASVLTVSESFNGLPP
jgi:hypothetical protein